jgi:hypothetical protein
MLLSRCSRNCSDEDQIETDNANGSSRRVDAHLILRKFIGGGRNKGYPSPRAENDQL